MKGLVTIYDELKDDSPLFLHQYRRIKKEGLNKDAITDLLENETKLFELDKRVILYKEFIRGQQLEKQQLEKVIKELIKKRNNFDGISFI